MRIISNTPKNRVVELTRRERAASDFFEDCLDHGASCVEAAESLEKFGRRTTAYDPAFIQWLQTGLPS